jgi:hypothetical protein
MKRVTLAILLVTLASPAKALNRSDAYDSGYKSGENTCQAVWEGAKSKKEARFLGFYHLSSSVSNNIDLIWSIGAKYGTDHAIFQTYYKGRNDGIAPCLKEYKNLPERI